MILISKILKNIKLNSYMRDIFILQEIELSISINLPRYWKLRFILEFLILIY